MRTAVALIFWLAITSVLFAQDDAFVSEVQYTNGRVYFHGKPFTGTLYSDEDNVPNACDCLLKAQYKNGYLHGLKHTWYKNGKPKEKARYNQGVLQKRTTFYSNGNRKREEIYENGKLISFRDYYEDGSIKQSERKTKTRHTDNTEEKISGNNQTIQRLFYPNGTVKEVQVTEDGRVIIDSLFNENGTIHKIIHYTSETSKEEQTYNDNNVLASDITYQGESILKKKLYFENGKLKSSEIYQNGEPIHREIYAESGQLIEESNLKSGKKDGIQKKYNPDGSYLEEEYRNGEKIRTKIRTKDREVEKIIDPTGYETIMAYSITGKKIYKGFFNEKGQKDSLWNYYDTVSGYKIKTEQYHLGKKILEGFYTNGKKQGKWYKIIPADNIKIIETYDNGKRLGQRIIHFDRLIKNAFHKGDHIYLYPHFTKDKIAYEYILVRFPDNDSGTFTKKIIQTFQSVLNRKLNPVSYSDSLADKEFSKIIRISTVKTRYAHHPEQNNQIIAFIYAEIQSRDFDTESKETGIIRYSAGPLNPKDESLGYYYTSNKDKAIEKSLQNFKTETEKQLDKIIPSTAKIIKAAVTPNNKKITRLVIQTTINPDPEKPYVILSDGKELSNIALRWLKSDGQLHLYKVVTGGEELRAYLHTHPLAVLHFKQYKSLPE